VSITTTSDAKTMPDADLFSRYIRESANELEDLVKKLGKGKLISKNIIKVKSKSAPFFRALNRYLKTNQKDLKKYKGIYHVEVGLGDTTDDWEIDLTKDIATVKKRKDLDAKFLIEIEDESLFALYKGKLLLEEIQIQGRIKITGTAASKTKFLKLLTAFLER
jgi:hypothetical protein